VSPLLLSLLFVAASCQRVGVCGDAGGLRCGGLQAEAGPHAASATAALRRQCQEVQQFLSHSVAGIDTSALQCVGVATSTLAMQITAVTRVRIAVEGAADDDNDSDADADADAADDGNSNDGSDGVKASSATGTTVGRMSVVHAPALLLLCEVSRLSHDAALTHNCRVTILTPPLLPMCV
jgi:hypothetical protein